MGLASHMARDGLDAGVLWRGGRLPARALFAEADHTNVVEEKPVLDIKCMVRRGAEKLHLDRHSQAVELYDLEQDPAEQVDLARARPERVAALLEELHRFQAGAVAPEAIPAP